MAKFVVVFATPPFCDAAAKVIMHTPLDRALPRVQPNAVLLPQGKRAQFSTFDSAYYNI